MKSFCIEFLWIAFILENLADADYSYRADNKKMTKRVKRQAVTWRLKDVSLLDNLAKDILMLKNAQSQNGSSNSFRKRVIANEVLSINKFHNPNPFEERTVGEICDKKSCSTENSFRQRLLHKPELLSSQIMQRLKRKQAILSKRTEENRVNLGIPDIYEMQLGGLPIRRIRRPLRRAKHGRKQIPNSPNEKSKLAYKSPSFISLGAIREFQKDMRPKDFLTNTEERILAPPIRPLTNVPKRKNTGIRKRLRHRRPIKVNSRSPVITNQLKLGLEYQSRDTKEKNDNQVRKLNHLQVDINKDLTKRRRKKVKHNKIKSTFPKGKITHPVNSLIRDVKVSSNKKTSNSKIPNYIQPQSLGNTLEIKQISAYHGKNNEITTNAYFPPSNNFPQRDLHGKLPPSEGNYPKISSNVFHKEDLPISQTKSTGRNEGYLPQVTYFSPSSAIGAHNAKNFQPINQYNLPSLEYTLPSKEYRPPKTEYSPPSLTYQIPNIEYSSRVKSKHSNQKYKPPSKLYQPPTLEYNVNQKNIKSNPIYGPPRSTNQLKAKFIPSQPDYINPAKAAVETGNYIHSRNPLPPTRYFPPNETYLKILPKEKQKVIKEKYIPPVYHPKGTSHSKSQEYPTPVKLPVTTSYSLSELPNYEDYNESYDYYGIKNNLGNSDSDYYYDYVDYDFFRVISNGSSNTPLTEFNQQVINEEDIFDYGYIAGVPGIAGFDYPILNYIPDTIFRCHLVADYPGYYADIEAGCQVFHVCHNDGTQDSYICPNGTIFNQKYFVCDWWYNFSCEDAAFFYPINALIEESSHLQHTGQTYLG